MICKYKLVSSVPGLEKLEVGLKGSGLLKLGSSHSEPTQEQVPSPSQEGLVPCSAVADQVFFLSCNEHPKASHLSFYSDCCEAFSSGTGYPNSLACSS